MLLSVTLIIGLKKTTKAIRLSRKNNFLMTHTDMLRIKNESETFISTTHVINLDTFLRKQIFFVPR